MTDVETEIRDIKQCVMEISKKLDELVHEQEMSSLMKLSEESLSEFFMDDTDFYRLTDLKVRYK
jgi:hypothetical protein